MIVNGMATPGIVFKVGGRTVSFIASAHQYVATQHEPRAEAVLRNCEHSSKSQDIVGEGG